MKWKCVFGSKMIKFQNIKAWERWIMCNGVV